MTAHFESVDDVRDRLAEAGYLASDAIATTVFLADALGKPLLVEGPAGVGKTELAKAVAAALSGATGTDADLVRLQCYEGIDEARALYEWNHAKQLLRITANTALAQASSSGAAASTSTTNSAADAQPDASSPAGSPSGGAAHDWDELATDIFTDDFLLTRPLLRAIRNTQPTVLLIDELDKADVEVEGLLLEVLSDFQVTVPELGTISATQRPFVVLTSNAARDLSEALRRRCLFLHIDYPTPALEQRIVELKVPGLDAALVESVVRLVHRLRQMPLRKAPSVAETVDWARTLIALGADGTGDLDATVLRANLGVLLKHQDDIERASTLLKLDA
ncbi:MoxR family ATPase [Dermacoccus nishinomiyaensis]|uniref:AAA family ATPase n=1 Tax=Dermacoccus TaxID=57495 RepID=UPI0001E63DCC|nr:MULTISPECIES: MoxR family ATPase [Dermacoccus]EFP58318.1 ATPase, AAA family [Dermacoccus sp. Ellin185]MCT1604512.1 MoxR family ATPase [Dermacoccus nishinomiyaensis]TJZ95955.1 MoxR family ATPase [Dermacoccus nishinomiyaensis]